MIEEIRINSIFVMNRLKLMTVVGTRPEIIRLSASIEKFEQIASIEHILVHTGQNYDYELNEIFFNDLNIRKPDYFLNAAGDTAIKTIGSIFINVDDILEKVKPNALLVLGDTNSCLVAIPAKRREIPIFHMEAGNRCFDFRVPEETNRRIIDHISDINLAYSSIAKENLLREGLPMDRVFKTGSPMKEVLTKNIGKIEASDILKRLNLEKEKYFVVSSHREENIESENFNKLIDVLQSISKEYNYPIIVSTHPRTRKKVDELGIVVNENIHFLKPLGFIDYVNLQMNAFVTLSDSGTISEESSILNFRALNLRETHERQEAIEEGSVMMVGMNKERIYQAIELLEDQPTGKSRRLNVPSDYNVDNVSDKVVNTIISYVDYVNRVVWQKG